MPCAIGASISWLCPNAENKPDLKTRSLRVEREVSIVRSCAVDVLAHHEQTNTIADANVSLFASALFILLFIIRGRWVRLISMPSSENHLRNASVPEAQRRARCFRPRHRSKSNQQSLGHRKPEAPLESLPEDLAQVGFAQQLEDAKRLRFLHQTLEQLSQGDRRILRMTMVEGSQPGEIAACAWTHFGSGAHQQAACHEEGHRPPP